MNRRTFMQAVGAIGIGGALPGGKGAKAAKPLLPTKPKRETWESNATSYGQRAIYGRVGSLYCKKAGIKAKLLGVSLSRGAIELNPNMPFDTSRHFFPGPISLDCEIEAINIKKGKLAWCRFNVCEWTIIWADKSTNTVKGFLTHYSFNADVCSTDKDTMSLTIQEA